MITPKDLHELADNEELMEVGRHAIENALVMFRDRRMSTLNRRNGFVIAERSGKPSNIIRFGNEYGVAIALREIAKKLERIERKRGAQ